MNDLLPALKLLIRNPLGPLLMVAQIGLTISILSALYFGISNVSQLIFEDSGIEEAHLGRLQVNFSISPEARESRIKQDLRVLSQYQGVAGVAVMNRIPLDKWQWVNPIHNNLDSDVRKNSWSHVALSDHNVMAVLGVSILKGRGFEEHEIKYVPRSEAKFGQKIVITESLADHFFTETDALGKLIYWQDEAFEVIGVSSNIRGTHNANVNGNHAVFVPVIFTDDTVDYVIRTEQPVEIGLIKEMQMLLRDSDRDRIVGSEAILPELKSDVRKPAHFVLKIMATIYGLLVGVCGFGVIGLTSYRVANNRLQIAIRRALGASRWQICRFIMMENVLLFAGAMLIGLLLGPAILTLITQGGGSIPLPWNTLAISGGIMLVTMLAAAAYPAYQATKVSPASVSGSLAIKR